MLAFKRENRVTGNKRELELFGFVEFPFLFLMFHIPRARIIHSSRIDVMWNSIVHLRKVLCHFECRRGYLHRLTASDTDIWHLLGDIYFLRTDKIRLNKCISVKDREVFCMNRKSLLCLDAIRKRTWRKMPWMPFQANKIRNA